MASSCWYVARSRSATLVISSKLVLPRWSLLSREIQYGIQEEDPYDITPSAGSSDRWVHVGRPLGHSDKGTFGKGTNFGVGLVELGRKGFELKIGRPPHCGGQLSRQQTQELGGDGDFGAGDFAQQLHHVQRFATSW
jgi:hypothetical protein